MATNSCEDLVIKKVVVSGEKGDPGVPGPAGSGVTLPIDATDVNVTNIGYTTVQSVLDYLLYIAPEIFTFTTPTIVFEKRGSTDTSADFTMTFNWEINKIVASQTLIGPVEMTPVSLASDDTYVIITLTNFNSDATFTLTVTDSDAGVATSDINVTFLNRVYYGDAAIPGATDSTFIASLSSSLQGDNEITVGTNTTDYFWYCAPVLYGTPNFVAEGFTMAMESPTVVSFTNSFGHTEDYNVFRATNNGLGGLTVDITNG